MIRHASACARVPMFAWCCLFFLSTRNVCLCTNVSVRCCICYMRALKTWTYYIFIPLALSPVVVGHWPENEYEILDTDFSIICFCSFFYWDYSFHVDRHIHTHKHKYLSLDSQFFFFFCLFFIVVFFIYWISFASRSSYVNILSIFFIQRALLFCIVHTHTERSYWMQSLL